MLRTILLSGMGGGLDVLVEFIMAPSSSLSFEKSLGAVEIHNDVNAS